jgi:murein DD-endopeptidase MepM/ murein hydrolase activator NlpD
MKSTRAIPLLAPALLAGLLLFAQSAPAAAQDRAASILGKNDADGDGRIARDEWKLNKSQFDAMDLDKDGYLSLDELRARFASGKGPASQATAPAAGATAGMMPGQVGRGALDEETFCGVGRFLKACTIKIAIKRGLHETGLRPRFPEGLRCRDIDEQYAINYTGNRGGVESYHGGIDMPAPFGTPILAAAAGTVITKTGGADSYRGVEIIIRHAPEDTGLPLWIYTQYAHFDALPAVEVGDRVKMGQKLGSTGNSGLKSDKRRPAIHFAVWYSTRPQYVIASNHMNVIPVDGWWMDPNALYRGKQPFDSATLKALPEAEKQVQIPVMLEDGTTVPAATRIIWPYACEKA